MRQQRLLPSTLTRRHLYHYAVGGQFARVVHLQQKLSPVTPAGHLIAFLLGSTMPWQVIDSML